ncbi:Pfs domain-containing protein [Mycena sanguinolenta]|uniref:Pfs domain-containing protein n=1 Tax=Mycena sanguinolenta TaxID=230812 RepID=A0A8H6XZX4_9AGAR|nr:Pfs domain-containing protein [Mycena sanguinolenta]
MTDSKNASNWFHRKKSATPEHPSSDLQPMSDSSEDSAQKSGHRPEWVLESVLFALELAEKALDIAEVLPFVGPAAALLGKIIESYREMKSAEEARDALAQRIADLTGDICATVLRMEEMNHSDQIGRLKQDLDKFATAGKFIEVYDNQGKLAHFSKGMQRKMNRLNRDLDWFCTRFGNNRLVDLCIHEVMNAQTLEKLYDAVTEKKLEEWLQSPDMKQKQRDTEQLRAEGTGKWFLEDNKFIRWEDNAGVLWIEGPSGSGKSVLSSIVIQRLFEEAIQATARPPAVAFFYFDFRNKETQSLENALRRIVLQLSAQSPSLYATLDSHYQLSNGQKLPTDSELRDILRSLLRELGRTYIVLDALDECNSSDVHQLVEILLILKTWTETPLHVLITSQTRDIFTERLGGVSRITFQANIMQREIESFVAGELRTNQNLTAWQQCADLVIEKITEKSNGMFRLAACLLTGLSNSLWGEAEELATTLEKLPSDLFEIYDRFILSIPEKQLPSAVAALRWIMFAQYQWFPLVELADAIAFNFSNTPQYTYMPTRWNANITGLPKWLAGLIEENDSGIMLAHASVQDYLLSDRFKEKYIHDLREDLSHEFISRCCLSYLLSSSNHLGKKSIKEHPFGKYAAKNWYHHLLQCADQKALLRLAMHLLENGSEQYRALCRWAKESMPPLHFCCKQGYLECIPWLLESGADINTVDESGSTLSLASWVGNMDIVHLLIKNGANINLMAGRYDSPLTAASMAGHVDIIHVLLENGANINLAGREYGSALVAASYHTKTKIVQLLLDNGADVNQPDSKYCSALGAVCHSTVDAPFFRGRHLDIIRLLLSKGADVNLAGGTYGSALGAVSHYTALDVVKLLLSHGADINMTAGKFSCALVAACASTHGEWMSSRIVRFLLQNGPDIESHGSRALKEAIERGHHKVVALLHEYGAALQEDVNQSGQDVN